MKTNFNLIITILIMLFASTTCLHAQNKPSIALLHMQSHGLTMDSATISGLTAIELEKTKLFNVADKYDVMDALQKAGVDLNSCYGRECLAEAGKAIHVDKVLSGSVEHFPNKIIITVRIIDVASAEVEKSSVNEFLDLPDNLQEMIGVALKELLQLPVDKEEMILMKMQ
jgi:TolB-like protein